MLHVAKATPEASREVDAVAQDSAAAPELRPPEPGDVGNPCAEGDSVASEGPTPEEDPAFAVEHEGDLWPDAEIIPEEKALARRFSEKDAPQRRRRFNPSGKGVLKGILKVMLFLLVAAVAATLVWSAVYMVGTHTPIADMPGELLGFFQRLFA